ncbi:MAG: hypothetical protein KZY55_15720 [Paeniclostridium sp.]|nr:hypothetical protein [Paeniclostridium sp.]MBW4862149.1 hypothetical protein [Paeniclostridium sp.]MBW4875505.1 hypothetical protein [Paeniclostridium sp.]
MSSSVSLNESLNESFSRVLENLKKSYGKKKTSDSIDTVMFISFDIVNSSLYKSSNYSGWFKVIYSLLNYVYTTIVKDIKEIKLWRTIGDELVFVVNIYKIDELGEYTQIIYEALIEINKYIKNGELFKDTNDGIDDLIENNLLELKATAWIARVSEIKSDDDLNKNITGNICYYYDNKINIINNSDNREKFREYQGKDIDLGFRIASKNTIARKLLLSVELAYILSESDKFNQKLHIVGYNKLKGVWNGRPYPIIWYHDAYVAECKIEESFAYDEDEDETNPIVYNYFKRKESDKIRDRISSSAKVELKKVIKDRNLQNKIDKIKECIEESNKVEKKALDIRAEEKLEVHCVAVCLNKEGNKVLMFKRACSEDVRFEGCWDFGCAKVIGGWTFRETLETEYKKFSNLDIDVKYPFKDYNFEDKDTGVTIPGIRYIASVKNESEIDLKNKKKYVEFKWVDLNEFNQMQNDKKEGSPFINYEEFRDIIETVLLERNVIKNERK